MKIQYSINMMNPERVLKLFAAFVAVHRISKIFIAAGGAGFRLRHLFRGSTATGTKFGIGSQVFGTFGALIKYELLMAALGAKFGVNR